MYNMYSHAVSAGTVVARPGWFVSALSFSPQWMTP